MSSETLVIECPYNPNHSNTIIHSVSAWFIPFFLLDPAFTTLSSTDCFSGFSDLNNHMKPGIHYFSPHWCLHILETTHTDGLYSSFFSSKLLISYLFHMCVTPKTTSFSSWNVLLRCFYISTSCLWWVNPHPLWQRFMELDGIFICNLNTLLSCRK